MRLPWHFHCILWKWLVHKHWKLKTETQLFTPVPLRITDSWETNTERKIQSTVSSCVLEQVPQPWHYWLLGPLFWGAALGTANVQHPWPLCHTVSRMYLPFLQCNQETLTYKTILHLSKQVTDKRGILSWYSTHSTEQ